MDPARKLPFDLNRAGIVPAPHGPMKGGPGQWLHVPPDERRNSACENLLMLWRRSWPW